VIHFAVRVLSSRLPARLLPAAAVVVVGLAVGPAIATAANVPPLSCAPSTVTFGTTTNCTAVGSPTETFVFSTTGSGTFSARSCTIAATANSCSVSFRFTKSGVVEGLSYAANGFSSGATTVVSSVRAAPTDIFACPQSGIVFGSSVTCRATAGRSLTINFSGTDGTFNPTGCPASSSCATSYTPGGASTVQELDANFVNDETTVPTFLTVVRPVAVSMACAPGSVTATQSTTCTATVRDISGGPAPTGTVSFASAQQGTFSSPLCSLTATGSTGSCTVSYTPTAVGSGTRLISGAYNGDSTHAVDSASTSVAVTGRPTAATVLCSPGSVFAGRSTTCTATITDLGSGPATPTGTVAFTSDGPGGFGLAAACVLAGGGASASCTVAYTPGAVGSGKQLITAGYSGDETHLVNTASMALTVSSAPTSTFVGCSPTAVTPGHATTCTATVGDDGPGAPTTPTGTVSFSSGGAGKLSRGGQCTLSGSRGSASCAVSFTPGRTQSNTPTLTARYGGDFGHTGSSGSTTVAPVAGMTANVAVIQGTVLISLPRHAPRAAGAEGPSSATYVPLKGGGTIPVGSTVDATNGTVMLATAADYHGALDRKHRIQTGIFSAAIFTIEQQTAKQQEKHSHRKATGMPPTNLRLITPAATTATSRCHAKGAPGRAIVREMSARAKGFFRVIAAASVTIVRNAQWTVEDRCDGTLTGVGRGTATVTYLLHHRPVSKVVKAGAGLLVKQRFPVPPTPTVAKGIPLPPGV
jgi:Big-like domain-containing protein